MKIAQDHVEGKTLKEQYFEPKVLTRLIMHLGPIKGVYLDVGCSLGYYANALFQKGYNITGIDISKEMLQKASKKNNKIKWVCGNAANMPFEDDHFDGAISILDANYLQDLDAVFKEVFRVLKKGPFVLFTAFPEQIKSYWLNHYFPKLMLKAQGLMKSYDQIATYFLKAGFQKLKLDRFYVTNIFQGHSLYVGKYRPEVYLNPKIRKKIFSFASEEDQKEIQLGCQQLEEDIESSCINRVISSYDSDFADYAFVVAVKP